MIAHYTVSPEDLSESFGPEYVVHLKKIQNIIQSFTTKPIGSIFFRKPYFHKHSLLSTPLIIQRDPSQIERRCALHAASLSASVCLEIGFNAGHSALLMLLSNPHLHLTSVDISVNPYVEPCASYILDQFPDRFTFIKSSSSNYFSSLDSKFPFDLIHLDGGHDFSTAFADLRSISSLTSHSSSPAATLLVDDMNDESVSDACAPFIRSGLFSILPSISSHSCTFALTCSSIK